MFSEERLVDFYPPRLVPVFAEHNQAIRRCTKYRRRGVRQSILWFIGRSGTR